MLLWLLKSHHYKKLGGEEKVPARLGQNPLFAIWLPYEAGEFQVSPVGLCFFFGFLYSLFVNVLF